MCDARAASEKRDSGAGPAAAAFNTNAFLLAALALSFMALRCLCCSLSGAGPAAAAFNTNAFLLAALALSFMALRCLCSLVLAARS
jgi:hypothetical protein